MTGPERVAALESLFGDPFDPANPLGLGPVLVADEQGEGFGAGERALDAFALNTELVPVARGGRFTRLDDLVALGRVVSRRDPGLCAGYLTSSLLAAVCVRQAGDDGQRSEIADLLLGGHRLACAYHELAHGNDLAGVECSARRSGDHLVLDGRKEVVANLDRAEAVVLFVRTGEPGTPRAHSQVLLRRADLTGPGVTVLPRYGTSGLRGVHLGGLAFDGVRVPADRLLGAPGQGVEHTLKAFGLTRIALPGMMTSAVDTALRVTVGHLRSRTLYGAAAIELPHLRSALVDVFVTLLAAEAFVTAAARAAHVLPGEVAVHAPAVKYAVSRMLATAMDELATVLGAHSYLRVGPTAIVPKLLRDVRALGVVHLSRAASRATLLPQLPLLARRSWGRDEPGPASLFARDVDLPPLDPSRLRVSGDGHDHLLAGLTDPAGDAAPVRALVERLAAQGDDLRAAVTALPVAHLAADAPPASARVVDDYVRLALAGACVQTGRHRRDEGEWTRAWVTALLARCARVPVPAAAEKQLAGELVDRCTDGRDLGLSGHALPVTSIRSPGGSP